MCACYADGIEATSIRIEASVRMDLKDVMAVQNYNTRLTAVNLVLQHFQSTAPNLNKTEAIKM